MKATICDICCRPIIGRQHKIIIKKEVFSFHERWFNKMDICEDCADGIIYTIKIKINKEDNKNDN